MWIFYLHNINAAVFHNAQFSAFPPIAHNKVSTIHMLSTLSTILIHNPAAYLCKKSVFSFASICVIIDFGHSDLQADEKDRDRMNTFTLHNTQHTFTAVPNYFLDKYMPEANGEFVKVYLYLLRCFTVNTENLSISLIADKLKYTEADVMRAFRYWEQEKLLLLRFENDILSEVSLTVPETPAAERTIGIGRQTEAAALTPPAAEYEPPAKPHYTAAQLNHFMESDEISQVLYVTQRYLGRTLTPTETNTVLYFYDSLKFPPDLIEYLIEYCVSRDKKSMRYIETVALSWAKQGIHTIKEAKEISSFYNTSCFAVMKAFGLSNRNPADAEISFIRKWTRTMGFSLDIILEACSRTIQAIHQPSFEYADSILTRWQEKGVKHFSDIQNLDQIHKDSKETKQEKSVQSRSSNNRFNNITTRSYLYDDLEKQLLGR